MADASASSSSSPADVLSRFHATSTTLVQYKIRHAFDNLKYEDCGGLNQFWAPVKTTGGRWLLTTSDQPFAVVNNHDGGRKYRLRSVKYQYNIDVNNLEIEEDPNPNPTIISGAPATAFLNRMPELVPDLRVHRMNSLDSSALQCGLFYSVILPIFYPSESCCVGVVECCSSSRYFILGMLDELTTAFEEEGLIMFNPRRYINICGLQHTRNKINAALDIIWPKFHSDWPMFLLDVAQVWIAYKDEEHVEFLSSLEDSPTKRVLGLKLTDHCSDHESYEDGDDYVYECFSDYKLICHDIPMKMGEGLIGKTFKNHKPGFIRKVSKLSDNQPLTMVRDSDGEGDPFECSCFAICLRSTDTGDLDYVFEFLWHEVPNYVILLESLLLLLKRYLPNFKYASGGELGDELPIIYVEDSTKSNKVFRIFKGKKSSSASEALENSSVGKECLTTLEAKCKTTPIPLSEEGMIEAAENLYVSLSTLKRKRGSQSNTNEEDTGTFQDPSANNREMCLDENTLTIKAEYADDMIKFTLPISSATFVAVQKEIGKGFELNPANYKIKYLDEDGDWILLKSDEDIKVCIKGRRNISSIVRLRLVQRQPSDPSLTCSATGIESL